MWPLTRWLHSSGWPYTHVYMDSIWTQWGRKKNNNDKMSVQSCEGLWAVLEEL